MNGPRQGLGGRNIQALLASSISSIARVKMILPGLALEQLIISGFLKALHGRFVGLYLRHIFRLKKQVST
jgi:hypothetical protein